LSNNQLVENEEGMQRIHQDQDETKHLKRWITAEKADDRANKKPKIKDPVHNVAQIKVMQSDRSKDATERHRRTEALVAELSLRANRVDGGRKAAATAACGRIGHRGSTFHTEWHWAYSSALSAQRQTVFVAEAANDDHYKIDQHPNAKAAKRKDHQNAGNNLADIKPVNAKRAEEKAQESCRNHAFLRNRLHSGTIRRAAGRTIWRFRGHAMTAFAAKNLGLA